MIEQILSRTRTVLVSVVIPFASMLWAMPRLGLAQSGAPVAMSPDRPGLSALLPAQSFAVAEESSDLLPVELALEPLDEDPLTGLPPESVAPSQLNWQAKTDAPAAGARMVQTGSVGRRSTTRMRHTGSTQGWVHDVGKLTYQQDNGSSLSMGQVSDGAAFWGPSARLGGVQLTRLPSETSRGVLLPGAFGMSAAVGRISNEDLATTGTGGLTVGAPMASSTMKLGLTSDLTLESHLQSGAESNAFGMGGAMAIGEWGAVQVGATQSQDALMPTLKSGLGMQFKFDTQQFESTYETLRSGPLVTEQHLGFKHSWLLFPQTRIQIGAARELMSGTYSMNMQLSVPFETLATQWWRF